MPTITYIEHDGTTHVVEAKNGSTVMETAVAHAVPGIVARCGGACSCATCHVYVDADWSAVLPPPALTETDMLDFALDARENSRLSCQITVTDALDGLVLRIPGQQA